jgi:hypothetical protein
MNRRIGWALTAVVALVFAGCAQVKQVATGDVTLKNRLVVTIEKPWNQFETGVGDNTPTWTQEGVAIDALRFYVGLKDGELIAPTPPEPKGQRPLAFKAAMNPRDVIALFEGYYSQGGSTFTLDKVTPQTFLGQPGYRFEFSSVRKVDEVRLLGVGWAAVRNGELFAITYTAPRLTFFARHLGSAEAVVRSARVTG